MSVPFFATDEDTWEEAVADLPMPWREAWARIDLRYHENRAGLPVRPKPFPGRVALAKRWGWTDRRVRDLLTADNWHDPHKKLTAKDLRPGWKGAKKDEADSANGVSNDLPMEGPMGERLEANYSDESANGTSNDLPMACPRARLLSEPRSNHTQEAPEALAAPAAECVSPESNPTPTTETTDGRHDASEQAAADPRPDDEPDAGDPRGPDADAGGADGAEPGGVGGGEGGAGAAGGADLTRLWTWMTEERRAALPGAGKLTLTPAVRKTLRARLGEHGEADLRAAWVWMLRSNHPRAVYLRAGGYAHPSTFLRPGNCGTYLDLARESGQNPAQGAPGAADGTGAGGQATPEAERAWEVVQSAALDTRYHAQCPPPAFSRDPDRDRRVRLALRRIGGWPALVSDIHDHWRAKDMRAAFVAAYAMEAA